MLLFIFKNWNRITSLFFHHSFPSGSWTAFRSDHPQGNKLFLINFYCYMYCYIYVHVYTCIHICVVCACTMCINTACWIHLCWWCALLSRLTMMYWTVSKKGHPWERLISISPKNSASLVSCSSLSSAGTLQNALILWLKCPLIVLLFQPCLSAIFRRYCFKVDFLVFCLLHSFPSIVPWAIDSAAVSYIYIGFPWSFDLYVI